MITKDGYQYAQTMEDLVEWGAVQQGDQYQVMGDSQWQQATAYGERMSQWHWLHWRRPVVMVDGGFSEHFL
jgi:hypothetical protein